jgi:DNA-binding transcriptional regulator YiaG
MTPNGVRRARKALGLSQSKFAARLGVTVLTVKRWEAGTRSVRVPIEHLIRLLVGQHKTKLAQTRRR